MQKIAVIVAGGSGSRMQNTIPKQFLLVHNKPLLYYTIKAFLDAYDDMSIVLVLPVEHIHKGDEIIDAYFDKSKIKIVNGGETRFHSVQQGLQEIEGDAIIFVHDGVRSMVTTSLIQRCYQGALDSGTAIPVIRPGDSVRILTTDGNEALDRNQVMLVQTPQTFHSKILLPAFQIDYKDRFTDEATVVEAYGLKVALVEGEESNIKITRPLDLVLALELLREQ